MKNEYFTISYLYDMLTTQKQNIIMEALINSLEADLR